MLLFPHLSWKPPTNLTTLKSVETLQSILLNTVCFHAEEVVYSKEHANNIFVTLINALHYHQTQTVLLKVLYFANEKHAAFIYLITNTKFDICKRSLHVTTLHRSHWKVKRRLNSGSVVKSAYNQDCFSNNLINY